MASFIGTYDEFTKFISPRARNLVNSITRNYKARVGVCMHCNTTEETLEAAHIRGKDRPAIIEKILKEFTNGEIVTIDLDVFENKFIEAHKPIEETIIVLCRPCHRAYDSPQQHEAVELTELEIDNPTITNAEITDYFRHNVPKLLEKEIDNLKSLEYCQDTFGLSFAVLKEVPRNSNIQEIRNYAQVNGYNRWSTQRPAERGDFLYLIVTQWFERQRTLFLAWKNKKV